MVFSHLLIEPSTTDDPAFVELVHQFPIAGQASNLDTRILLVLSGLYLGFLPPHYASKWLERGDLRELLPETFTSQNTFHLLLKKSARQTAAAQRLTQIILKHFRQSKGTGIPLPEKG